MPPGIYKRTKEHIRKIVESREWYKHSPETREKISKACRGKKLSDERRSKMSEYMKNNPHRWSFKKGEHLGKDHPNWKGKVKKTCKFCSIIFEVYPFRKDIAQYCSRKCHGKSKIGRKENPVITRKRIAKTSGKNHYNFQGWKSREPYGEGWNDILKKAIRKRDNYKCRVCGVPQEECLIALLVHHIDEVKTNLNPDNLISLCRSCHGKVHFKKIVLRF